MSATKERLPLAEARQLASELVKLLGPACERLNIAGSIRRDSETVGDIELVAVPKVTVSAIDLFGDVERETDELDSLVHHERVRGRLDTRPDKNGRMAVGERYKRLLYRDFPLDLFAVKEPAQFGLIYLIRTGPAGFSHWFVTPKRQGGCLPDGFEVRQGALWRYHERLITPEERDVFDTVGMDWIAPEERR